MMKKDGKSTMADWQATENPVMMIERDGERYIRM